MISFSFIFAKYSFFPFSEKKHRSFYFSNLFSSVGFFNNLFLKRVLCIKALQYVLVLKGLLFPQMHFFFSGCVIIKNTIKILIRFVWVFAVINKFFTESILQGIHEPFIVKSFKIPIMTLGRIFQSSFLK